MSRWHRNVGKDNASIPSPMGKMALSEHFQLIGNRARSSSWNVCIHSEWHVENQHKEEKKTHNKNSVLITLGMENCGELKRIMKLYILPLNTVKGLVVSSKLFKHMRNV